MYESFISKSGGVRYGSFGSMFSAPGIGRINMRCGTSYIGTPSVAEYTLDTEIGDACDVDGASCIGVLRTVGGGGVEFILADFGDLSGDVIGDPIELMPPPLPPPPPLPLVPLWVFAKMNSLNFQKPTTP